MKSEFSTVAQWKKNTLLNIHRNMTFQNNNRKLYDGGGETQNVK